MSKSHRNKKLKAASASPAASSVDPFVPAGLGGNPEPAELPAEPSPASQRDSQPTDTRSEPDDNPPAPPGENENIVAPAEDAFDMPDPPQADIVDVEAAPAAPADSAAAAGPLSELARRIEALLLASDEPLTPSRVSVLTGATRKQIRDSVDVLNAAYEKGGHSFRIEQIADGLQMLTLGQFNPLLEQLLTARKDSKLSQAALETLAVVAYKQPVTRADIEIVRGVACGEVLRTLMEKRLVKIVGRAEILGRPMLYGTTRRFLEIFGLRSIEDLPKAEALTDPDKKDLGPAAEPARGDAPVDETGEMKNEK